MSIHIQQKNWGSNSVQIGSCNVFNNSCVINGTAVINNKVILNGKELPTVPSGKIRSSTIIGDKVYVNGYEWKDGKWKKTLKALWYKWFQGKYMKYRYDKEWGSILCEPSCADEWIQQIWMVGCGYDGCYTVESLRGLVDELIEYSHKARECLYNGKIFEDKEESERSYNAAKIERDRGDINAQVFYNQRYSQCVHAYD